MNQKYVQRDDTNVSFTRDVLYPSGAREAKGMLGGAVVGGLMFGAGMLKHKVSPKILANTAKTIPKNIKKLGENYNKVMSNISEDVMGNFIRETEDMLNNNASKFTVLKTIPKQYASMSKKMKPALAKGMKEMFSDGVDFGDNVEGVMKTVALGGMGLGLGAELTEMTLRNEELNDLHQQYLGKKPKAADYMKMHIAGVANLASTIGAPIPSLAPVRIATKMYTEPAAIVQRKRHQIANQQNQM